MNRSREYIPAFISGSVTTGTDEEILSRSLYLEDRYAPGLEAPGNDSPLKDRESLSTHKLRAGLTGFLGLWFISGGPAIEVDEECLLTEGDKVWVSLLPLKAPLSKAPDDASFEFLQWYYKNHPYADSLSGASLGSFDPFSEPLPGEEEYFEGPQFDEGTQDRAILDFVTASYFEVDGLVSEMCPLCPATEGCRYYQRAKKDLGEMPPSGWQNNNLTPFKDSSFPDFPPDSPPPLNN